MRLSEITAKEDILTKKAELDTKSFKPKAKIVCKPARADNDNLAKDDLFDDVAREITQQDVEQLDRFADRVFSRVGIDVEFTRHFLQRVNDERNGSQITMAELTRLFKQEAKKHGKPIARLGPNTEAVLKDMQTDINAPFVLQYDRANDELDLIVKTIMRKPNFGTSSQVFAVERKLSKGEEKKREKNVKSLKKNKKDFKKRYGDDWESVMYGTATNQAKKK
jgi:hypothetical protein